MISLLAGAIARCWLIGGVLACYACTPTTQNREACYASAEAHAATRAVEECRAGWAACKTHDAIMAELASSEKVCP